MYVGLKGDYNFKGIPLRNAFARIDVTSAYDTIATASVNIYASYDSFLEGSEYLEQIYPLEFKKVIGENVGDDRTQGYLFIKDLEQFKDWDLVVDD